MCFQSIYIHYSIPNIFSEYGQWDQAPLRYPWLCSLKIEEGWPASCLLIPLWWCKAETTSPSMKPTLNTYSVKWDYFFDILESIFTQIKIEFDTITKRSILDRVLKSKHKKINDRSIRWPNPQNFQQNRPGTVPLQTARTKTSSNQNRSLTKTKTKSDNQPSARSDRFVALRNVRIEVKGSPFVATTSNVCVLTRYHC